MPFKTKSDPANCKVSFPDRIVRWDKFANFYYRNMDTYKGTFTVDARRVFGNGHHQAFTETG